MLGDLFRNTFRIYVSFCPVCCVMSVRVVWVEELVPVDDRYELALWVGFEGSIVPAWFYFGGDRADICSVSLLTTKGMCDVQ